MNSETLPPLREALDAAGIRAEKRFGQHFLLDLNICRKISKIAEVSDNDRVLEVGPGPGGLTRALLEAGALVTAVERDERFLPMLTDIQRAFGDRLAVAHADALAFDDLAAVGPGAKVAANLPYNIASPLLVKWLTGPLRPKDMTLMFQTEVARRIIARPGDRDYGRLAVLAQLLAEARIAMSLPARAFTPPPKVDSAVVRLIPYAERPADALIAAVQTVSAAAFGQRRKMLRSSLRSLGGADLCEAVGIDPNARAETAPPTAFLAMARVITPSGH
ncbi:MAG TPA: 16S rRNA (adenine(1518)-N(6)/adenine(1519)-N(6))-dimethyltransferase RsmA [Caulobacteraceae bacterium]